MAKTVTKILGVVFLLVGLIGFVAPGILGMHLSVAHNIVHLISGALALYFGLTGTLRAVRSFCIIFGVVYGLLGLLGLVAGTGAERMLTVIPGQLILGKMDHIVHVLLGAVFLLSGVTDKTAAVVSAPLESNK
jgi:hypothetical protein